MYGDPELAREAEVSQAIPDLRYLGSFLFELPKERSSLILQEYHIMDKYLCSRSTKDDKLTFSMKHKETRSEDGANDAESAAQRLNSPVCGATRGDSSLN